ncbi:hypothetical protein WJX82_007126 [Trebouxia sp. C0006]|nr:MAG: DNA-directed RNA polymerase II subunit RPB9-like [Trebouxia sp. A1-2]
MEDVVPSAGGLGDAFADEDDVIAPGDRIGVVTESKGPKLRFCPESNDILYPREDKQRRVLIYACKSCSYEEDADPLNKEYGGWCVYRNEVHHSNKEKTVILKDVKADPTLPRTNDVECAMCKHKEAVFFSSSTEEGMTLYLSCTNCGHKWRDNV